ncbi:O-methyltransferas-like protein [Ophiobolus disseminans]|uniref:O-methyltransferas-like protein n=1 Tax=Ophiobolus disseminans TaxID=1469910 RepID=A0A6A6ZWK9_9PLEO|nr:O-methyltransferas-like protein [Ophiobolus disseminans]
MSSGQPSILLALAKEVEQLTSNIVTHLEAKSLREPTFETDSESVPETPELIAIRARLNDTTRNLLRLVNGPKNDARTFMCYLYDLAAWQVACEFNFFEAIPEDGKVHARDIAERVGMDEDRVARFLRMLTSDRVFEEVEKDMLDEFFKATSETSASIQESPTETNGQKNAFVTRHGTDLFQFYKQDSKRATRFASAMAGVSRLERHFETLKESYHWDQISNRKVIDVGGGSGHMSVALARTFPNFELIVEDSLTQNEFSDLNGRVTFMPHDFFTKQPVSRAAAYLLRYITHNWSDADWIRIFRALVPALEKSPTGTQLLINDVVLPALGEATRYHDNRMRQADILIMLVLGAKQRTEEEFRNLLSEADARFKGTINGKGNMSLIETYLETPKANDSTGSDIAEDWEEPSKGEGAVGDQQENHANGSIQKRTGSHFWSPQGYLPGAAFGQRVFSWDHTY